MLRQRVHVWLTLIMSMCIACVFEFFRKLSVLDSVQAVRVQILSWDIVLCSWVRLFTLAVSLFNAVHKWTPADLMQGITAVPGLSSYLEGGGRCTKVVDSCYVSRDKLQPGGLLGWYAELTFLPKYFTGDGWFYRFDAAAHHYHYYRVVEPRN